VSRRLSIVAAAEEAGDAPAVIREGRILTFAQAAAADPAGDPILSIYASLEQPSETLALLHTSGSTGTPKGVILSRVGFLAAAAMSARHLGTGDDRHLLCLPLTHTGGLSVLLRALVARQPLIVCDGPFDPMKVARLGREAGATMASLVPTQLDALVACGEPLPPWRAVLVGGAAAAPAILERARGVPFLMTYGMTETWGQVATQALADAGRPDAPLVPLPGVTITAGTADAPAPIVIDTPAAMTGYVGEPPHRGPIVTADLGYTSPLTIVGRADDLIITGGENVHPAQVEAAIAGAPGVRAACAFGVPDERWGQLVACAIVAAPGLDLGALRAWLARLPSHLRPRRLEIVDALPVLPGGKVDRRALQARLA
jgi:O-succinylbenzoic acid--CoA ligase